MNLTVAAPGFITDNTTMTYRSAESLVNTAFTILGAVLLTAVCFLLDRGSILIMAVIIGPLYVVLFFIRRLSLKSIQTAMHRARFEGQETGLITTFINQMRICFTMNDFLLAIKEHLEKVADASVVLYRLSDKEVVYQSPQALSAAKDTGDAIKRHYPRFEEGVYFIDQSIGLVSSYKKARGFFIVSRGWQFWIFLRYCKLLEPDIFKALHTEFGIFIDREKTVQEMFTISALAKEWDLVAETQESFLPKNIPELKKLELATYYRPLVNVSGDYYDIIPIDENRTLLVLGDVSGKGLAAALVMGIIMSTVRISGDKTDLKQILGNVDAAIKGMRFEDKYTVVFMGVIDVEEKKLTYANASMDAPVIISQTVTGTRVRTIESNNSLVGLIPMENIQVDEVPIRTGDVIMIVTDGVTEVSNEEGQQLGDSELYQETIKKASTTTAQEICDTVSSLVLRYAGNHKLRDDVTMLVAKVGKLWD